MARPRRTTSPQRTRDMRRNSRRLGANMPFQGGLGQGTGAGPQGPAQPPSQGQQQCPPGQAPARDPRTGAQTCKSVQPNISSNVPVKNSDRALKPTPGRPLNGKTQR